MASLNEFIDPDLTAGDVVHSSGYASAGMGGTIGGSAGGLSMEERRKRMYGRTIIGDYKHSKLGRTYGLAKSRSVDQVGTRSYYDGASGELTTEARYVHPSKDKPASSSRQGYNATRSTEGSAPPAAPARRFVEPPARRHNPYG